jgi:hypothetical protein
MHLLFQINAWTRISAVAGAPIDWNRSDDDYHAYYKLILN